VGKCTETEESLGTTVVRKCLRGESIHYVYSVIFYARLPVAC